MEVGSLINLWAKDTSNSKLFNVICNKVTAQESANTVIELFYSENRKSPFNSEMLLLVIKFCFKNKNLTHLDVFLNQLYESKMAHREWLYYSVLNSFINKKFDDCLSLYHRYLDNSENNIGTKLVVANALYQQLKLSEALDILGDEDSDPETLALKSLLYYDSGQLELVKITAEKALSAIPNSYHALIALTSFHIANTNYSEAIHLIKLCLNSHSNQGRAWSLYSELLIEQLEFEESLGTLNHAVKLMPNHVGTWHMLAWVNYILDKKEDAYSAFECAYELDPAFADSQGGMAIVHIEKGDLALANKYIQKAKKLDKNCITGIYAEALINNLQGDSLIAQKKVENIFSSQLIGASSIIEIIKRKLIDKGLKVG